VVKGRLPGTAQAPLIVKTDPSSIPIMGLMVQGSHSPEELRELTDNTIAPRLEQVNGVAQVSVSGGRKKIIRVEIPQSRLEAYGLAFTTIQQMLAAQNTQVSAGSLIDGGISYVLTTMGEYTSVDQIKDTVIAYRGGGAAGGQTEPPRIVRLRDIADIFEGYRDEESLVYINGVSAIQLSVTKQGGKNSVQTARELRAQLAQIARELPQDIRITEISNTTDMIENSINNVISAAVQGALLAVLTLFIFLRSLKSTLIIGVSIPVSIIITVLAMYFGGLTLNVMTLAGLALGIGMLVDNSVVILENIYRYREKGSKLTAASVLGSQEMIVPIICSTLTTICVFLPLVMFQGLLEMIGELFAGLAFTVVVSLTASLVVALFLVPVLSSHYLPMVTRKQRPLKSKSLLAADNAFVRFFASLDNAYRRGVDRVLRHKLIFILVLLSLFAGSILMIPVVGFEMMPAQTAESVTMSLTLPLGTPLAETEAALKQLEAVILKEAQGVERLTLKAGGSGANTGSLQIKLVPFEERIDSADDIQRKLRAHFNEFPGAALSFGSSGGVNMGAMGGGSPVDIVVRTNDLVKGKAMAEKILGLLKANLPEITEPDIDLDDGLPQLEIYLDRERLYALGLSAATVGNEIRAVMDGITATQFKNNGTDYEVVLFLAEADRHEVPDLDHIFVNSPISGQRVSLSNVATYAKGTGPVTITRENQSRVIHVTAGTMPGTKLNEIEGKVRALINANIPAEDGIVIEFSGEYAEMMKYTERFALIIVVAILLLFGVMAALFESFRDPFIIIFCIPLSVIGVVAIYFITGRVLNIMTAVGLLVLVGVVVNNGIVLVDYTNMLRKRGYSLHDACVEAAGSRLRPILMTTVSTALALVPMAFFPGEGSEYTADIGLTVLGGLSFGTLMTLFLMPTIYAIINKHSGEREARAKARREGIAAGLTGSQARKQIKPVL
jgi:HAE1 family hydrophobic/amphiphilic exporter-1